MPTNAREFLLDLKKFENLQPDNIAKIQRAVTLELQAGLMRESPVDTGRFRANWQVQASGFATDELERTNQAITIGEALAEVQKIKPFTLTGISNNLPYAVALNDGHSKQTPRGMVERQVARVSRIKVKVE